MQLQTLAKRCSLDDKKNNTDSTVSGLQHLVVGNHFVFWGWKGQASPPKHQVSGNKTAHLFDLDRGHQKEQSPLAKGRGRRDDPDVSLELLLFRGVAGMCWSQLASSEP